MPVALAAAETRAAAPVQGVDFSGTNVQEEGVDEPDMVKTDGTTLFAIANGKLNAVDVSEAKPRLLDSLQLENGAGELLLHRNRLLVLSNGGYWIQPLPAMARSIAPWQPAKSVLAEIDVSDPKKLRLVRTLELDGSYVAARLVGGTVRIVAAAQVPSELPFAPPASQTQEALAAAKAKNRSVVASSRATSWLPSYRIKRAGAKAGKERPLVQCRHVSRPPEFSGFGMLTVLTVDLAKGLEPVHSTSVMTDGRIVYASPESLYVATERWSARPLPEQPTKEVDGVTTAIHKFDISSPTITQYRGSGTVSGYLLSQWSLSEHKGVLRVVSTESPAWWGPGGGESESFLTTLRPGAGALVQAGRIGGLGKGERVYSVRFVGDTGYVVTFRQIDPLYTLDLANPASPRVLGELKIPGYSAYLHPIGEDLLLGVGQDATEEGRATGTQISIFDVSDLRKPDARAPGVARAGLVGGRARPPRVPLLAAHRARDDPVQPAGGRASGSAARAGSTRSGASSTTHSGRSAARSSSATPSSPCRRRASCRARSRPWPSAAGPRSRRPRSKVRAMPEFTSYAHGTPCWTDVTSTDLPQAVEFYEGLFGWTADAGSAARGGRLHDVLAPRQVRRRREPAARQEGIPSHWTTYLASDDVDATAAKIRDAGGTVLAEPFDVFDSGRMTVAQDPTGAHLRRLAGGHAHRRAARERARDDDSGTSARRTTRPPRASSTSRSSGTRSMRPSSRAAETYHVLKVDGSGVAGILRMTPQMEATCRRTGRPSSRWRTRTRRSRRRRSWAATAADGAAWTCPRSAGSRCSRIRPAPSSRCVEPPPES